MRFMVLMGLVACVQAPDGDDEKKGKPDPSESTSQSSTSEETSSTQVTDTDTDTTTDTDTVTTDTGTLTDTDLTLDQKPDFLLWEMNATSRYANQQVSPRQELGRVSGWYFGHAT